MIMPGINGREVLERLLYMDSDVQVLMMSGYSESDELESALQLGARGLLRKPFRMEQLASMVCQALEGRQRSLLDGR